MLVRFLAQHPLGDLLGSDALPGEVHDVADRVGRALLADGLAEPADDEGTEPAPIPAKPARREAAARKGAPERAARPSATKRG